MKAKGVASKNARPQFVTALDGLRGRLEEEVLRDCFGITVGDFGPAEFYVQETDTCSSDGGECVNYNLSGVTIKEGRKFDSALEVIEGIIIELIEKHWPGVKIQIMVVIHASDETGKARLFESKAKWIDPDA